MYEMKKILTVSLFFALALNTLTAQNQTFDYAQQDFSQALQLSKTQQKPVLLFLYASWCSHCNKMKKEVFSDSGITAFVAKNFVPIAIDAEKGAGVSLKQKYSVSSFPAFIYIDQNNELLYALTGEFTAEKFIEESKNALDPAKQLPQLEKTFLKDPTHAAACYAYILALKKGPGNATIPAQKYFSTLSEKQLVSDINWRIFANAITDINSREFQYVLNHQKEFAAVSSPFRVEKKMVHTVSELLRPFTETLDTTAYFKQRSIAKTIQLRKTDSLIFTYDLLLAERTKNWKTYQKTASESAEAYYWQQPEKLKEIAAILEKNVTENVGLIYGLKVAERAVAIKPSADGYLLVARLLQKMNQEDKAVDFGQKSRSYSQSLGFDTKDADEFLNQIQNK